MKIKVAKYQQRNLLKMYSIKYQQNIKYSSTDFNIKDNRVISGSQLGEYSHLLCRPSVGTL